MLGITFIPSSFRLWRILLFIPLGVFPNGVVFELEALNSFCVVHGQRGTYDFNEKYGWPYGKSESETRMKVENEEWRKRDRRKAALMYFVEAPAGGLLLAILATLV